jgi:primosomal protein N' (replication factor Y)
LLTQVAGRAGRGSKKGIVVVQTFTPNHYAIVTAKRHDFDSFYATEIKSRAELAYPPFTKIVNIIIRDKDEKKVCDFGWKVKKYFEEHSPQGVKAILGPAPLPFFHLRGYYRWHVMLKLEAEAIFDHGIKNQIDKINRSRSTQFVIDVDAVNIL